MKGQEARALSRFRDPGVTRALVKKVSSVVKEHFQGRHIKLMHVCGSHEHTITYFGLRPLLPESLELVAGPGCPVCVCSTADIREAIEIAKRGATLCTFGDMLRDRTPYGSLDDARREGADVRMVYSPHDALKMARENPQKKVVFFGVGFETTSAPISSLVRDDPPENFSILTSLKRTSPAVEALLAGGEIALDGIIAPGHVSTIVGGNDWKNLPERFEVPTTVAGFEPVDVLLAILELLEQIKDGKHELGIEYQRLVTLEGNVLAQRMLAETTDISEAYWRAMGNVAGSGYYLKPKYGSYDARKTFNVHFEPEPKKDIPPGCKCHLIVTGRAYPSDCALFEKKACRPDAPSGPCMVSGEGTCYIWYRFGSTPELRRKLIGNARSEVS